MYESSIFPFPFLRLFLFLICISKSLLSCFRVVLISYNLIHSFQKCSILIPLIPMSCVSINKFYPKVVDRYTMSFVLFRPSTT